MKGLFVTGTDTNIGKTFISCLITNVLKEHGVDVGVMKPFATAYKRYSTTFGSEDAWRLSRAAKVVDPYDLINPYFYQIGTAPFLTSNYERKAYSQLRFCSQKIAKTVNATRVSCGGRNWRGYGAYL